VLGLTRLKRAKRRWGGSSSGKASVARPRYRIERDAILIPEGKSWGYNRQSNRTPPLTARASERSSERNIKPRLRECRSRSVQVLGCWHLWYVSTACAPRHLLVGSRQARLSSVKEQTIDFLAFWVYAGHARCSNLSVFRIAIVTVEPEGSV
jgi:hypothetical protein